MPIAVGCRSADAHLIAYKDAPVHTTTYIYDYMRDVEVVNVVRKTEKAEESSFVYYISTLISHYVRLVIYYIFYKRKRSRLYKKKKQR